MSGAPSSQGASEEPRYEVVTIGEAAGGEESCDTSSSSDGEGSSDDNDWDGTDNVLNKPIEQEALAGLRYRIVIEASKGPVRWFEVPSSSFTVGRAKENQVCLSGDDFLNVSRTHLKVEYAAGRLWITDTNSSKGTHVDATKSGAEGGTTALVPGKVTGIAEGSKVNLGGCVDLTFKVQRSEDVVGRREKRRLKRKESGGGRAQFVSDLQNAVFRRKITEVGTVATRARQRRERKPLRNDEFGRRSRSRSRSRSNARLRQRESDRDKERGREREVADGGRNKEKGSWRQGRNGAKKAKRSRSRSSSSSRGRARSRSRSHSRGRARSRSRSHSRGRSTSRSRMRERASVVRGGGRVGSKRSRSRSRGRVSPREPEWRDAERPRGGGRKEGVDAERWEHRPLSLSPSPARD